MCSVSAPLLRHVPCLWLQAFQNGEDRDSRLRWSAVAGALSAARCTAKVWSLPSSLLHSAAPLTTCASLRSCCNHCYSITCNLCCTSWWVMQGQPASIPQQEVNRAEFPTAEPRGVAEHLPAISCSCVPAGGGRRKGEPSHRASYTSNCCAPCYWHRQLWPAGKNCAKEQ